MYNYTEESYYCVCDIKIIAIGVPDINIQDVHLSFIPSRGVLLDLEGCPNCEEYSNNLFEVVSVKYTYKSNKYEIGTFLHEKGKND